MKIAKATGQDMAAATLLVGILEDVDGGSYPREVPGETDPDPPEYFDEDDPDHLKAFYRRVMHCVKSRPSGISRVVWGMATIMENNILDPNVAHLALHPRFNKDKAQTGRTKRMLDEAAKLAAEGKYVIVVAANENMAKEMCSAFIETFPPEKIKKAGATAKSYLNSGSVTFETPESIRLDWISMLSARAQPSVYVLVDHFVIESRFHAMLKMLHRFDL